MEAYRAANSTGPRNVWPVLGTAQMLFLLGDLVGAEAAVAKSLSIAPLSAAFQVLANIMIVRNKLTESLRSALQATQTDHEDATGWLKLADVYARMKQDNEALKIYRHALGSASRDVEIDPNDGPSWMLMALLQCRLEDRTAAKLSLRKAEEKNAIDIYSLIYKVRLFELFKQRDQAIATLTLCLKMGATATQIKTTNDLEALTHDPRFNSLVRANPGYQPAVA